LVGPLREVDGALVTRLKTLDPPKRYRALCRSEQTIDPSRIESLAAKLLGVPIQQRTPQRVSSRADKVRPRHVLALAAKLVGPSELELELTTESGTYVKELVSSDEGRTEPSVASVLGVAISVAELDVLEILATNEEILGVESRAQAKPNP
ncbi:MAG: tRNA pseudouridine(54/55) synthase Pus10, partial [Planctomycetota bacterium]